jgi:hypothetical protein
VSATKKTAAKMASSRRPAPLTIEALGGLSADKIEILQLRQAEKISVAMDERIEIHTQPILDVTNKMFNQVQEMHGEVRDFRNDQIKQHSFHAAQYGRFENELRAFGKWREDIEPEIATIIEGYKDFKTKDAVLTYILKGIKAAKIVSENVEKFGQKKGTLTLLGITACSLLGINSFIGLRGVFVGDARAKTRDTQAQQLTQAVKAQKVITTTIKVPEPVIIAAPVIQPGVNPDGTVPISPSIDLGPPNGGRLQRQGVSRQPVFPHYRKRVQP